MSPRDPTEGLPRPLQIGVLVSGSGTNLQAILDAAATPGCPFEVAVVIANRPAVGALDRAAAAGVPAEVVPHRAFEHRADFDAALVEHLRAHDVGVVALAGFMRVLTPAFLQAFPLRVVNVHPALCPAFPGVRAPAQALAWGVKITGCTVHLVDAGTDTGPVIFQDAVRIAPDDDPSTLHARIQSLEHRLLPAALRALAQGRVRVNGRVVRVQSD